MDGPSDGCLGRALARSAAEVEVGKAQREFDRREGRHDKVLGRPWRDRQVAPVEGLAMDMDRVDRRVERPILKQKGHSRERPF